MASCSVMLELKVKGCHPKLKGAYVIKVTHRLMSFLHKNVHTFNVKTTKRMNVLKNKNKFCATCAFMRQLVVVQPPNNHFAFLPTVHQLKMIFLS